MNTIIIQVVLLVSKINTITELLLKFTDIDEILWDDRLLHIPFSLSF
jgi:hypothetical protein